MGSLNKVTLIGNLGSDPELKYAGEVPVCNLSLATTYKAKDKPEQVEWHRVTLWRSEAENAAKYLKKGRQVYVEGRLTTRTYQKDGITHKSTEVQAERIVFLGSGKDNEPANQQREIPRIAPAPASPSPPDDWD